MTGILILSPRAKLAPGGDLQKSAPTIKPSQERRLEQKKKDWMFRHRLPLMSYPLSFHGENSTNVDNNLTIRHVQLVLKSILL